MFLRKEDKNKKENIFCSKIIRQKKNATKQEIKGIISDLNF